MTRGVHFSGQHLRNLDGQQRIMLQDDVEVAAGNEAESSICPGDGGQGLRPVANQSGQPEHGARQDLNRVNLPCCRGGMA